MEQNFNPQVGDRVTYTIGSDHYAFTVSERAPRKVTARKDKSTQVGEFFGDQRWISVSDPNGAPEVFTLRGDGSWRLRGRNFGFLSAGSHQRLDPGF
jgi:hypothetical protein